MATEVRKQGEMGKGNGKFELDNLTYDLIAILHEKSQALEAYDRYLQDAGNRNDQQVSTLLEQVCRDDQKHIRQIQGHLARLLNREARVIETNPEEMTA